MPSTVKARTTTLTSQSIFSMTELDASKALDVGGRVPGGGGGDRVWQGKHASRHSTARDDGQSASNTKQAHKASSRSNGGSALIGGEACLLALGQKAQASTAAGEPACKAHVP